MVDFHSHILPYIDDGSKSFDMSIDMLKLSVEEGTDYICATSHFIPGEVEQNREEYFKKINEIKQLCALKKIDINIIPALELYMHPELPRLFKEKKVWGINNTNYILIELPMQQFPVYTEDIFYELRLLGAMPILAHPERNFRIMKDVSLLENLVDQGVLAQINAGSLRGIYGKDIKEFAEMLIKRNLIHMVGSDAHDDHRRTTKMSKTFDIISNTNRELYDWIKENQYNIIQGKEINPLSIKKSKSKFNFFGLFK
ncbi:protein tyrosine phosphatase [Clostridium swellfunianum]|uniref:tyrosine-protein phosphatase n=1 Tax=Clostridium swellfunianum TaxID=1367462 RepID=UPI00202DEA34|nr:CpsB/CapC family capsule biosynthesis tyrosine phosphatase [Clostridium swellfunianum]MCM0651025.1 protein tyrosine phosphatase [Clostridium swellfunianum]